MGNLSGSATLFVSKSCSPTPQNECEVRPLRTGSVRMLGRPPVPHALGSSTTLSTVDALREFPSRETQSTHDQASTGNVGNQADSDRERES